MTPAPTACTSGKRRYTNRVSALLVLSLCRRQRSARRRERRSYFCTKCRGYHLTSQQP